MPRADLRAHPFRCLSGSKPADPRDFPVLHRPGRAALARRSLPRRHSAQARATFGYGHRGRDQAGDQRDDRPHRIGRRVVQQVLGQGRLRCAQAGRPHRDPAGAGRRVHRAPADRALLRHRPQDRRENERARHLQRRRSRRPLRGRAGAPLRQGRPALFQDRTRLGRARGATGPAVQVDRRRAHLRSGPSRSSTTTSR